jgi:hypothetical protein
VNSGTETIARLDPCARDPAATIEEIAGPPRIVEARAWAADARGGIWLTVRGSDTLVHIDRLALDPGSTLAVIGSPLVKAPDGVWLGEDGGDLVRQHACELDWTTGSARDGSRGDYSDARRAARCPRAVRHQGRTRRLAVVHQPGW